MAPLVKVTVTTPVDLRLGTRNHMVEGENQLLQLSFDLHTCTVACRVPYTYIHTHTHTHMRTLNKCKSLF